MNENDNPAWAMEYDTPDVLEALAIASVLYADWRDGNAEAYRLNPAQPTWLNSVAPGRFLVVPGFRSEPTASFNGSPCRISHIAALAIGISRPLTPLFLCLWNRLIEQDGSETPASIGDLAETLLEYIGIENEERHGGEAA